MFAMNALTVVSTDLLTPLGAYLRLREDGRASFLLESVEHGRLGRPLVRRRGLAARRTSRRPRPASCRSSATSATTTRPGSSRRSRCPRTGASCRRAGSSSPTRWSASTTAWAWPRCSAATRRGHRAARRAAARPRGGRAARGLDPRACPRGTSTSARSCGEGAHPRRRRLPDRPLPARRAADLGDRARALPLAAPRQPLAVPLPARARRARPRRLLAGDARQGRGATGLAEPDRWDDAPRRGRRGAAASLREGPGRACDAGRPRPQRSLAGLPARHGEARALPRAGALLARHAPGLRSRRRARGRCLALRPPARLLPGRTVSGAPKVRAMQIISELERYRRGPYAGAVVYALPGDGARHLHRDPDDRAGRRRRAPSGRRGHRRRLRPGGRARRVPAKLAALETAIELAEARA